MTKINYDCNQEIGNFGIKFLEEVDPIVYGVSGFRRRAKFACLCGNSFVSLIEEVKRNTKKSCGCLNDRIRRETGEKRRTHGMSKSLAYSRWTRMKGRCYNPNNKDYPEYGGRGINVCERWLESFQNFYEDMGECPEGMSLDRINVEDGYDQGNCRWATPSEQAWNQRVYKTNKSGKAGVTWNKKASRWEARISKDGVEYYLGFFSNVEDAISARENAELSMYGELKHESVLSIRAEIDL